MTSVTERYEQDTASTTRVIHSTLAALKGRDRTETAPVTVDLVRRLLDVLVAADYLSHLFTYANDDEELEMQVDDLRRAVIAVGRSAL